MNWLLFVLGAVLSWGLYGPMLHKGQVALGSPLKALLCVGVAYFLIGVLVPVADARVAGPARRLQPRRQRDRHDRRRRSARSARVCIILAFRAGGSPLIVMPLVFGGAPLVNVLYSMAGSTRRETAPSPLLYLGFLLAAVGAFMVLYFKPAA